MSYTNSFTQAASIISGSPVLMNAFYDILAGIAQTEIVRRLMNENHLAWTVRRNLDRGDKVREIYVALIEGQVYDPEDQSYPLDADKFDVDEVFHRINYKRVYTARYSEVELLATFESIDAFNEMMNEFPRAMYDSLEMDEYLVTKYQIGRAIADGVMAQRSWDANASIADQNAAIKTVSSLIEYPTQTEFNQKGVHNPTPKNMKHIVMTSAFQAERDNGFLASVFNLEKTELDTDYYNTVDSFSFTSAELNRLDNLFTDQKTEAFVDGYRPITASENEFLATVPCCVFDERYFQNYRTFVNMRFESVLQPKNLNRYLFLHHWKVLSTSPFHNAIVFLSGENGLSTIDITTLGYVPAQNGYVAGAADAAIKDVGYASGANVSSLTLPIGAISEGSGLYPKFGTINPADIGMTLSSTEPTVQEYITKGLLRVTPLGDIGKICDTATKTYGSDEAYGDITDRTAPYGIYIDASIRQGASGWTARSANLTISYKGISKTKAVTF